MFHAWIQKATRWLQQFVNRIWYPPLLGLLAAFDNFVVVVPTDGLLVSSCMLTPRRWFSLGLLTSLGSTLGAALLASLVRNQGAPWVELNYPELIQSEMWELTHRFFIEYGLYLVFAVAASPLMQQPTVILATLAGSNLVHIISLVLLGRTLKFLFMAYVASHTPRLLKKLWGIRGELEDVGVDIKSKS